jgi:hypothetical protein
MQLQGCPGEVIATVDWPAESIPAGQGEHPPSIAMQRPNEQELPEAHTTPNPPQFCESLNGSIDWQIWAPQKPRPPSERAHGASTGALLQSNRAQKFPRHTAPGAQVASPLVPPVPEPLVLVPVVVPDPPVDPDTVPPSI